MKRLAVPGAGGFIGATGGAETTFAEHFGRPGDPAGLELPSRPHACPIAEARRVLGYETRIHHDEGMARVESRLRAEGRP